MTDSSDSRKVFFTFEEMELKALCYLCAAQTALFMTDDLNAYPNEIEAREDLEDKIMKIIEDALKQKVEKGQCQ